VTPAGLHIDQKTDTVDHSW